MSVRLSAIISFFCAFSVCYGASLASAEKRIALLIGNESYVEAVGPLKNPHNDIDLIKSALTAVGFAEDDIAVLKDADRIEMLQAFDVFTARVKEAGRDAISFFYYSGHGAANEQRENYLIPVDVPELTSSGFWYRSVGLRYLLDQLNRQAPDARHFIVFDACRNELKLREPGTRALVQAKGFVVEGNIPGGMLVAFATAEGELASDVGESAGPYASVLAEELLRPGLEALTVFRNTQLRVRQKIGQEPWMQLNALGAVHFAGTSPLPARRQCTAEEAERAKEFWEKAQSIQPPDPYLYEALIENYPGCVHAEIAAAQLKRLREETEVAVGLPPEQPQPPACDGVSVSLGTGGTQCIKPGSGESFRDCPDCPEMVVVPAGSFDMGSPRGEAGRDENEDDTPGDGGKPVRITINQPFAVGTFEVTWGEWDACVKEGGCDNDPVEKAGGDNGWGKGRRPVIEVSWNDARAYAKWLNSKTGKKYRLLTEAEWEHTTRSGTQTRYSFGDGVAALGDHGWFTANSDSKTHLVGEKKPNAWGLYDIHGNVLEWVKDCYSDSYKDAPRDGSAAKETSGCARVLRGGSWIYSPGWLRSAYRFRDAPDFRGVDFGFRVARTLTP